MSLYHVTENKLMWRNYSSEGGRVSYEEISDEKNLI
jgi:hypothetical protein